MIPEPQRTYVLELIKALGPLADSFIVAGAQAMKFAVKIARGTKDIDFVLDVVHLRGRQQLIAGKLGELNYNPVPEARNFQFQKTIPGSSEVMRIEFMAPEEFRRNRDFRVEVQDGVHGRALTGGSIAVAEAEERELSGKLPDGTSLTVTIKVTKPYALVMLKLLAMDDRFRNIRGPQEQQHDREEARIHASDVIAIVTGQMDTVDFKAKFDAQFGSEEPLARRVLKILEGYFGTSVSPGLLLYEEFLTADQPPGSAVRREVAEEVLRAHGMMVKTFGLGRK